MLGVGGSSYAVPWSALAIRTESDKKPALQIATMTRKQLEAAPRLEARTDIAKPEYRGRVYQFFHVTLPEYEPDRDLLGRIGKSNQDQDTRR